MLPPNLSEMLKKKEGSSLSGAAAGGHDHGESARLGYAIIGGIFVVNSYIASIFFSDSISLFAVNLSAVIGAVMLSLPIFYSAIRDLIRGNIYMNELVALALIAAFADSDFHTAGVVAFFMLLTITIERRTAIGAEASIEALVRLTPRRARRLQNGAEEDVDALDLDVDDICRIRPGENFPADGIVISGMSSVNQASITGESLPVDKTESDEVYAGTQNLTGLVDIRINRVGEDTTLGKVRSLIVAAERSKLPIMRVIDKYVGYYTPTVLMIAALVWFFTRDLNRVIAVLVMSCPCAFVIAAPSAVIAAIASASRLGILIKDVAHIELAARIRAIVFDKTGTLTEGNLEVARLQPAENVELAELLLTATSTESHSNHPAAEAMRKLAKEAGVTWNDPQEYEEVPGRGVVAKFDGKVCRVGRLSWLMECGLNADIVKDSLAEAEVEGTSIVVVAKEDRILGWIGLRDAIRPVTRDAIAALKDIGIKQCCMVTGDNQTVADLVARKVGITEVRAGCLPQEKVDFVEELKSRGNLVAVVGDGVNDAPALVAGDIGIAMGAIGSDVAVQSASIALMNNDLRRIPFLISLARKTHTRMTQNVFIGLGFICVGLVLSTIGIVPAIMAALLHMASSLIVVFNSARLVREGESLEAKVGVAEKEQQEMAPLPINA